MLLRHIYEPKFGKEDDDRETYADYSFDFDVHPDNLHSDEYSKVIVRFKHFGRGEKPRNYEVEIDWLDFKNLFAEFLEAEHSHAVHLKAILKMARSLDDAGWRRVSEPPEFWENLLED